MNVKGDGKRDKEKERERVESSHCRGWIGSCELRLGQSIVPNRRGALLYKP